MRSDSSTPPGSRSSSTATPRALSSSASARASVDLPAPSRPSIVISLPAPRGARYAARRPRRLYDAPGVPRLRRRPSGRSLPGIEAHPHARAVLGPALAPGGSPSHAYLFHGPAGSGKRDVARAFAAALLADGAREARRGGASGSRGARTRT